MSYDIQFFIPEPNKDLLDQSYEISEGKRKPSPSPQKDEARFALIADLKKEFPEVVVVETEGGFSYGCWVGVEDYNSFFPGIDFYIDEAFVSMGYAEETDRIFRKILLIFEKHGYVAYDPQWDKILTVEIWDKTSK